MRAVCAAAGARRWRPARDPLQRGGVQLARQQSAAGRRVPLHLRPRLGRPGPARDPDMEKPTCGLRAAKSTLDLKIYLQDAMWLKVLADTFKYILKESLVSAYVLRERILQPYRRGILERPAQVSNAR